MNPVRTTDAPRVLFLAAAVSMAALQGCVVEQKCFGDYDCDHPMVCSPKGECVYECSTDQDCGEGFQCRDRRCTPREGPVPIECPSDMVAVGNAFCIDRYEASRPDADVDSPGVAEGPAFSRKGVMPWLIDDVSQAAAACGAAGKRLCTPIEWETACKGPGGTTYAYGDTYSATTCNGIDTYCKCEPGPHCYDECGADYRLEPTGSFPACTNEWGVFDINGNVWEVVDAGDALEHFRGGAYNCGDSVTLHRCDYDATWGPSAKGFRCCKSPHHVPPEPVPDEPDAATFDAAAEDVVPGPDLAHDGGTVEQGCIDDPGAADTAGDRPGDQAQNDPGPEPQDAVEDDLQDDGAATDPGSDDHADVAGIDGDEVDHGDAGDAASAQDDAPGPDDAFVTDEAGPDTTPCPADMVEIALQGGAKTFCMDRYEASHEDATADTKGTSSKPSSRPGVLPWFPVDRATAAAACESAGKRLCKTDEWFVACTGPGSSAYSYGDAYSPTTCNGIDTFCKCSAPACAGVEECPYPHCFNQKTPDGLFGPCGATFHVMPTGSFPGCTNEWGVFDINGNVWEAVDAGDALEHFRGGAYNCGDSEALHKCAYDATWGPSARGFRCCKDAQQQ